MYFRALTEGIADLPGADEAIRRRIDEEAEQKGWPAMHAELASVDTVVAARLNPNDSQRIQRALEVFIASGMPLSKWQRQARGEAQNDVRFIKIALQPATRELLHARIEERLNLMLNNGFIEEVKELYQLPGLTAKSPSMRSVGYRQIWQHLDGETTLDEAGRKALFATRQLAKRQITWLRSESDLNSFDPLEVGTVDAISAFLVDRLA